MTDHRDAIAAKIRALKERSTDNGFTEAEALAAIEKIGELMSKYRLTMSDVEVQQEKVGKIVLSTDRKQRHPVFHALPGISEYTGVKHWLVKPIGDEPWKIVFFGLASDVSNAKYLCNIARVAIDQESVEFRASLLYRCSDRKKLDFISFGNGMARAMSNKLKKMAADEAPVVKTSTGTALVVVKNAIVETAYKNYTADMKWTKPTGSKAWRTSAFAEGMEAGKKVAFNKGVESTPQTLLH